MVKLVLTPLGSSARNRFYDELRQLPYGEGILALPNRLLMEKVQEQEPIECVGIDTLAARIINSSGNTGLHLINRRSQELLIGSLLEDIMSYSRLEYFRDLAHKPGFIKAMTSLVGQLSRSGAAQEEISTALRHWHTAEAGEAGYKVLKDQEISLLYNYYRNYLKEKQWFDLEGKYRLALAYLAQLTGSLPWKHIYFSDFYSLDSLQLELIRALSRHCDITIGMCYEKNLPERDKSREKIFAAAENTYTELERLCLENGGTIEMYQPEERGSYLAANLGRGGQQEAAGDTVQLYRFTSQEEEMRWALTGVKQLLLQGVKPQQIVISMRDLNKFTGLRLIADEYGIPVTLPWSSKLSVQPLTEILLLLLQAKDGGHIGAEAYFRLLTAELSHVLLPQECEGADALRQQRYFTSRSEAQRCVREALAADSETLRLFDDFIEMEPEQGSMNIYVQQMQELLEKMHLEEKLGGCYRQEKISLEQLTAALRTKAELLEVLRQLHEDYQNCGRADAKITLQRWQELLQEAVEEVQLILRPGHTDGVLITEAVNLQGLEYDYVYLLGMREGDFPKASNENWIYNDQERIEMNALGIPMPTTAQGYSEDAYFFAAAAAAARRQLLLTYASDDEIGGSPYLDGVRSLFNDVEEQCAGKKEAASWEELVQLQGQNSGEQLWEHLGKGCQAAAQAAEERLLRQESSFNGSLQEQELQEAVKRNIGSSFSASALESYAACPFRFLGERVWRQQEFAALEDAVQPADEGDFLHAVLKEFVGRHLGVKLTQWPLSELQQELAQVIAAVSEEYLAAGNISSCGLWQAELPRLERLLQQWLRFEYSDQEQWADFTPCAVEWDFSSQNGRQLPLQLSDGSQVSLRGRIDRLDSDGSRLVVTDYKRSAAPSGTDLKQGLDLQLPVYLMAASELYGKETHVAGGCYFVLKEGQRKSKLMLESVGSSDLAYKCRSEDELNSSWERFQDFCLGLLRKYIEGIYAGQFPAAPLKGCSEYCPLRNICRVKEIQAAVKGAERP